MSGFEISLCHLGCWRRRATIRLTRSSHPALRSAPPAPCPQQTYASWDTLPLLRRCSKAARQARPIPGAEGRSGGGFSGNPEGPSSLPQSVRRCCSLADLAQRSLSPEGRCLDSEACPWSPGTALPVWWLLPEENEGLRETPLTPQSLGSETDHRDQSSLSPAHWQQRGLAGSPPAGAAATRPTPAGRRRG